MRYLGYGLVFLILACLAYSVYLSIDMRKTYQSLATCKSDYAEINKIDYGLFNMQLWKEKTFKVFSEEISQFKISPTAFKEADGAFKSYLRGIYNEYIASGKLFNQIMDDAEKSGKVNKMILKLMRDNLQDQILKLDIESYIPAMSKNLTKELKNNEPRFRAIMQGELTKMLQFDEKYPVADPRKVIFDTYQATDIDQCNATIDAKINTLTTTLHRQLPMLYGLLLACCLLLGITHKVHTNATIVVLLSLVSIVFLVLGITMPMIVIDARLNSFVFNLFETDLSFGQQTIFYQNKSILDVTKNLIESRGIDLKIVGSLIFCFSILFPFLKLILSAFYAVIPRLQDKKWIQNVIFYLGKWSMADVFVVAMFMAYIGFYGLVDSQLQAIEGNKGGFGIETVNYSSLQPGALFFTTYCVLSIIVGIVIGHHKTKKERIL